MGAYGVNVWGAQFPKSPPPHSYATGPKLINSFTKGHANSFPNCCAKLHFDFHIELGTGKRYLRVYIHLRFAGTDSGMASDSVRSRGKELLGPIWNLRPMGGRDFTEF